ncbi:FMN-binding negative transcriptional regulator [Micromonospora sp. NPDC047812]|uniref:FMN-binding negative transcriptional regulator n=1 Tax=Micromonospora sp. NPDC047812 TaxID=3155742 RepID=UPI0034519F06
MYVPEQYQAEDPSWTWELIDSHPLATLITATDGVPLASHVPTIRRPAPERADGTNPADSQSILLGHMNRLNPQWAAIGAGCPALLVYTGPDRYVSPTVYGVTPAAPTWNFTAVHVDGWLSPLPPGEPTLAVIRSTVEALEKRHGTGWDMTASLDYFDRLLPGVGAFELRVDRIDAMFKLSQEQAPDVRDRVAADIVTTDCGHHRELARLMTRAAGRDKP